MSLRYAFSFILTLPLIAQTVHAYESDQSYGYTQSWLSDSETHKISPKEPVSARLQKFELILTTLGIPLEFQPDFSEFPASGTLNEAEVQARLPLIDPDSGLRRYLNLNNTGVSLFKDFFTAMLPAGLLDYSFAFGNSPAPHDSEPLISHLKQIALQVKNQDEGHPLAGLKVVIDPGHMGTDFWDHETGKYVTIKNKKVSEGDINLWTALLVANELEGLGATVKLTHSQEGPVSPYNYRNYPITSYVNQYFYDSLDDWMSKYLKLTDDQIRQTIKLKPEVKKAYTELERSQLYVGGADLEARSLMIDQEKPDVVLDIHYDANLTTALQNSSNSLEAYVQGAFRGDETGSRKLRSFALKHLLDQNRFTESVNLAAEIVTAMSASEKVPLADKSTYPNSVKIKNGVYARNLYITRRNLSSLMVYLECLHYDHTSEFYNLATTNEVGTYHGINFQYPTRIKSVVAGIKTGFLNYFKR